MFSLHETTRKRTCRTAFFALCLAPTCATAAWIADHHLPWRDAAAARRLSDRYHLDVTLADLQEPRPSMTRLAGVTLAEPGVADPLLKLTGVETHRRGDAIILAINELTLNVSDLPALATRLEWSLGRTDAAKIELHVKTLSLQPASDAPPLTLHQLQGIIERDPQRPPRLRLLASLDGRARLLPSRDVPNEPTEPAAQQELRPPTIGLTVETLPASDDKSAPHQTVKLDTQQNAIPAALLAPFVPGMASLNNAATFTGVVAWRASDAGELHGRLDGVDLADALPANSPHKLTGTTTIELTDCQWRGERLQKLVGALTATDAQANGSFLAAAPSYLACKPGELLQPTLAAVQRLAQPRSAGQEPASDDVSLLNATHQFTHFACRFSLDAAGLVIDPNIPAASTLPADALAAIDGQVVLFCPRPGDGKILPAVAWIQFVASPPGHWIPYTTEALEAARRLPPQ